MGIHEALSQLAMATAQMKLGNILEADEALAKRFEEETERLASECQKIPETSVQRLMGYKEAIGEEMFTQMASNPNLQTMADEHWQEVARANFGKMVDAIFVLFEGHDIKRDDVYNALAGMTQS